MNLKDNKTQKRAGRIVFHSGSFLCLGDHHNNIPLGEPG
jgi:hypothetical protein